MISEIQQFEPELPCFVSCNGEECPLYTICELRNAGYWCPDNHKVQLKALLDKLTCSEKDINVIGDGWNITGGPFELVELIAQKYVGMGCISSPPVPTELVSVIDPQNPTEIHELPLKAYHGAVWQCNGKWIIQVRKNDSYIMRRLTIFHEAFHIVTHTESRYGLKAFTCQGSFTDMLADYFALSILMPRRWVQAKWKEIASLADMAEVFIVTVPAMGIRLRQLGLA